MLFPNEQFGIPDSTITLAEVLKQHGYATACVGKWHLGDQPRHSPLRHGFDYRYGLPFSNDMTLPYTQWRQPLRLYEDDQVIETPVDQSTLTLRYTQKAQEFIEKNKHRPFFLYLPHSMVHWPWFASGRFKGSSLMGAYGDAVEEVDWSVGELLKTLQENQLDHRTLVVFTSDNGADGRRGAGSSGLLRGSKGSTWEGGMREPFIARWPGQIAAGTVRGGIACMMDLFTTLIELAGAKIPNDRPIDGLNIWPMLAGNGNSPREAFYYFSHNWESRPKLVAIRSGKWKLHLLQEDSWPQSKFEPEALYNLDEDPSEKFDEIKEQRELVTQLATKAKHFHAEVRPGTLPPPHRPPGRPGAGR